MATTSRQEKPTARRKGKGTRPPPPTGGRQVSRAEREKRIAIVERCMAEGRSSSIEISAELEKETGLEVPDRTVRDYMRQIRSRRVAEDEETLRIRRTAILTEGSKATRVVLGLLIKHQVKPRWADLIKLMEFRAQYGGIGTETVISSIAETHEEDRDPLEELSEDRLDQLLGEFLEKVEADADRLSRPADAHG